MLAPRTISSALADAGVRPGDHLIVHSSMRAVGPVDGGANALLDALIDTVGPDGTIAMPAFNYSRPLPVPYFDPLTTPGATGVLSELFRRRNGTLRSTHPAHSVCARGAGAAKFLADHHLHGSFGIHSPLDRIASANGWTLLIGVSQTSNSMIHVGETHANIRKFWWNDGELPRVGTKMPDGRILDVALDCSSSCSMAFNAVEHPLRDRGRIRDLNIGNAMSYLMRAGDVIETVKNMIARTPDVLFCTRATCRPCLLGRAAALENR